MNLHASYGWAESDKLGPLVKGKVDPLLFLVSSTIAPLQTPTHFLAKKMVLIAKGNGLKLASFGMDSLILTTIRSSYICA
jgi:hypothetical protein